MMTTENRFEDLFFDPEPAKRTLARRLYSSVANLPIVSPHGHVDPRLFLDENTRFGSPAELLIIPDHYVYRMLYSQGIPLEALGVPRLDGGPVEGDHRKIWQIFADHFYLFRGTPTGIWFTLELSQVFDCHQPLNSDTAQDIYDHIEDKLSSPEFQPRKLFEKFNIEVLCTTEPAWDRLEAHQAIRASGWRGNIRSTFRPDGVVNLDAPGWRGNIDKLSQASSIDITSYLSFLNALEVQRAYFKSLGTTATDHAVLIPRTEPLEPSEAGAIFQRALRGEARSEDPARFFAHMLVEMARMSTEDGLVMQIHPGSLRNHNPAVFQRFGLDKGADIPVATEFTRSLQPLLERFGSDPNLRLILFTLDETTYARELAPLAGLYPAVLLGPPWWFHDSPNGMQRYFDQVIETAGLYNTAGFNDDTRAFPSIPARHEVWRRVSANWLAGQMVRGIVTEEEAAEMMVDLAVNLARRAYKL
ncbi:MAG: glucuronate isomerase [Chloroflexi bacterium]|nr:MAG: glucuronate isomerase [Chloroflexota bacterium]